MVDRNYEFEMCGAEILDEHGNFVPDALPLFLTSVNDVLGVMSDCFVHLDLDTRAEPLRNEPREISTNVLYTYCVPGEVTYVYCLCISMVANAGHIIVSILDEQDDSDPCLAPSFHNDKIDFRHCLRAYLLDIFLAITTDVIAVYVNSSF